MKKYLQNFKILVADDEEGMREFILLALEELGFNVNTAKNGEEAYNLAKKNFYGVILLDYNMPKLNGIQAATKILTVSPWSDVYLMSAYLTHAQIHESRNIGIRYCFFKPFKSGDIKQLICKAFHQKIKHLRKQMKKIIKTFSCYLRETADASSRNLMQSLRDKSYRHSLIDQLIVDPHILKITYNQPLDQISYTKLRSLILKKN